MVEKTYKIQDGLFNVASRGPLSDRTEK